MSEIEFKKDVADVIGYCKTLRGNIESLLSGNIGILGDYFNELLKEQKISQSEYDQIEKLIDLMLKRSASKCAYNIKGIIDRLEKSLAETEN